MATWSSIQSEIWYRNTKFAGRQVTTGNCKYLYEVNKKTLVSGRSVADNQKGRLASTIPIVTIQAVEGNNGRIYSIISQDTCTKRNFDV